MKRVRRKLKPVSILMVMLLSMLVMPYQAVLASMVGTEQVLSAQKGQAARDRVQHFLDREDVRHALMAQGIDPLEAKSRVDSLSDAEVARLSNKIEGLPAGGDVLGVLVGAALLVFIILLITDILGLTDVFTFVKKHK
jgi:hypothetical protein